jgi:exodeoxyribonuclease V beta subunit
MSQTEPGNGVYFVLPEKPMIEALDDLFSGKASSKTEQGDNSLEPEKEIEPNKNPQQQGQLDLW